MVAFGLCSAFQSHLRMCSPVRTLDHVESGHAEISTTGCADLLSAKSSRSLAASGPAISVGLSRLAIMTNLVA